MNIFGIDSTVLFCTNVANTIKNTVKYQFSFTFVVFIVDFTVNLSAIRNKQVLNYCRLFVFTTLKKRLKQGIRRKLERYL